MPLVTREILHARRRELLDTYGVRAPRYTSYRRAHGCVRRRSGCRNLGRDRPVVFTEDWARAAVSDRLTRVGLGVRDLTPAAQRAVNRNEPSSVIVSTVDGFRWLGLASVDFDVMCGLPRQATAAVPNPLDQLLTLRPDRLALFSYAHVTWITPMCRG